MFKLFVNTSLINFVHYSLPGSEALLEDGKKPGQMKMVREPGGVVAYTWTVEAGRSYWKKIGDVVGANNEDNKGKTQFEGKVSSSVFPKSILNIFMYFNYFQFYDFVFSVDVEDGKPPIKLPYNNGDDPSKAAQDFLVKNSLPFVYLEQVCFCLSKIFF